MRKTLFESRSDTGSHPVSLCFKSFLLLCSIAYGDARIIRDFEWNWGGNEVRFISITMKRFKFDFEKCWVLVTMFGKRRKGCFLFRWWTWMELWYGSFEIEEFYCGLWLKFNLDLKIFKFEHVLLRLKKFLLLMINNKICLIFYFITKCQETYDKYHWKIYLYHSNKFQIILFNLLYVVKKNIVCYFVQIKLISK